MIAPGARRILLGDENQCIYTFKGGVDPTTRVAAALALPGSKLVPLPPASFRDPTQVLPAAANAARERRFDDPAIAAASQAGRLVLECYML
jgi:DNA helicase-2/ATP-dependent DNA helicase PcrA